MLSRSTHLQSVVSPHCKISVKNDSTLCICICTRMDDLIFGRINTDMVRPSVPCMIHDLSQPHCRTHQTSVSWHLERFSPLWWNDLWIKRLCSSGYRIGLPRAPLVLWLLLPGMLTITNWIIIAKVVKEVSLGELLWLQFIEKCRSLTCLLFWPLRHQRLCRMRLSLSLIAPGAPVAFPRNLQHSFVR